ncbi:biotin--[acetyl-CoA-carboxylase] ligase [Methanobrevibacter oralis]|uniref:Bifunctional ligase/repressor BirA n=1 Tax=Methanobrevibacter oralis TaxID=66851 RepID=A0A162FC99_METOA|nr:biotin--[acetyl-CoA-carboxylase] ligase [Methanobrevibacter oralis]KZX10855.1 bifunctional ligase/repressor BirA [Methanobrevibacter oralis]
MQNEILKLLKKENKLSDDTLNEIKDIDINDFYNTIKEIGKQKTDYINVSKILKDLQTTYIGKNIYAYKEVNSTNTVAKFLSMNNIENGSVIISEKQSNAKGRSGKFWESPLGGIWLSIVLNPQVEHSKLPFITLATGVAVANALEKIGIDNAEIKWPNDIYINDKKVCGILTEAIAQFNTIENVIIGVGIDANFDYEEFPEVLKEDSTTLKEELGEEVDINYLIKIFLEEFEKIGVLFTEGEFEKILKEWRKRSYTIGKIVEVKEPFNKTYDAYVIGVDKDGALVVEKIDGTLEKVISGECIIKK